MEDLFALIKPLLGPLAVFLFFIAVVFLALRPLLRLLAAGKKAPRPVRKPEPKAPEKDDDSDLRLPPLKLSDQEKIRRLAASDPEKAKDLVKQWLRQKNK